jgi:Prophage CP4-57 regulatory protein (AlpA)
MVAPSVWISTVIIDWLRERMTASGQDGSLLKDEPPGRVLRLPEVEKMTTLSKSAIYRRIVAGTFPKPFHLN